MKNGMTISAVSRQLKLVCERIDTLTMDIEQFEHGDDSMVESYVALRMDELEHAQVLTLKLTELITQENSEETVVNTDDGGSAFAAGELVDNLAEQLEEEDPDLVKAGTGSSI